VTFGGKIVLKAIRGKIVLKLKAISENSHQATSLKYKDFNNKQTRDQQTKNTRKDFIFDLYFQQIYLNIILTGQEKDVGKTRKVHGRGKC